MAGINTVVMTVPDGSDDNVLILVGCSGTSYRLADVVSIMGQYTFSVWIRADTAQTVEFHVLGGGTAVTATAEWQKVVYTVDESTTTYIDICPMADTTVYLYKGMLQAGQYDTDWKPAPEDAEESIIDLAEITTTHATQITMMQGQIASLITEDTAIKGDYDALVSRYNATVATVDSLQTTIGEHTTLIDTNSNDILAVQTQANTIESDLSGTKQTVSSVQSTLAGTQSQVTELETSLSGLTARVTSAESSIEGSENRLTTAESSISALQGEIALKVGQTEIDTAIAEVQSEIELAKDSILLSVAQNYSTRDELTGVTTRLETAESGIALMADQIALKVEQTDIDTAINELEIGGRNLLQEATIYSRSRTTAGLTIEYQGSGQWNITGTRTGTTSTSYLVYGASSYDAENSLHTIEAGKYTIGVQSSGLGTDSTGYRIVAIISSIDGTGNTYKYITENSSITFVLEEGYYLRAISLAVPATDDYDTVDISFRAKLEKGAKSTDWTPAPEDVSDEAADMADQAKQEAIAEATSATETAIKDLLIGDSSAIEGTGYDGMTLYEIVTSIITRTTSLEQDSTSFNFNFKTLEETIKQLGDDVAAEFAERLKYIRFIDGSIILGDSGSLFEVVITNERISFKYNGITLSYLDTEQLVVEKMTVVDATIGDNLWLGQFRWFERSNGNLALKWEG